MRFVLIVCMLLMYATVSPVATIAADTTTSTADTTTSAASATTSRQVQVGNLVYAGTKTSKCFSDSFLSSVQKDSGINLVTKFLSVKCGSAGDLGQVGFAIMTGEGAFTMTEDERRFTRAWMENGGFLLASAGCSSKEWASSLRKEMGQMFGEKAMVKITADHPLFQTLYDVRSATLKHDGQARFEGVVIDGRLACLFSPEGLNDTKRVSGCCCCGGNEITNAHQIVANALVYALVE